MLGTGLSEVFQFDFGLRRFQAWLLVILPPIILFLSGTRTFVEIISLAGGVSLGLEQILIVFLFARAKSRGDRVPEYSLKIPLWLLYTLMAIFASGIVFFLLIH